MERNIIKNKIKRKINESEKGTIFLITDFLEIGSYDAVKNVLSKLVKEEYLMRAMRGIYIKPNFNEFLQNNVPASPDDIAKTIARTNNWTIGPKGDAALNILGLTTQIPAVYHYISDGPYKKVKYEGVTIVFNKRSNKDISGYSYKTILIIEAIRTLGINRMNNEIRRIIAKKCSDDDFELLKNDGKYSRRWIYEEIKKVLKLGGYENAGTSKKD